MRRGGVRGSESATMASDDDSERPPRKSPVIRRPPSGETLRPPSPGTTEKVEVYSSKSPRRRREEAEDHPAGRWKSATNPSVPVREAPEPPAPAETDPPPPPSRPPSRASDRAGPTPSEDPRAERASRPAAPAVRVRTDLDALQSSIPDDLVPDREQRIEAIVTELSNAGPGVDVPLRRQLFAFGTDALGPLTKVFPGSLWIDLSRPHRPLRTATSLSGVAAAMVDFGDDAVPHAGALLRASRPEIRLCAALVACDLRHGDLVRPLAARLQDEIEQVRDTAFVALSLSSRVRESLLMRTELIETIRDESKKIEWRQRAARTLGMLRHEAAVEPLIELLSADSLLAEPAREALIRITAHDLGRFRFRWRGWFNKRRTRSRARWLIEALGQTDDVLRAIALNELALLTGQGYDTRERIANRSSARELATELGAWLDENPRFG